MQPVEKMVINEAIKYVMSVQWTGGQGNPPMPYPERLEKVVREYLEFYGESLEQFVNTND